MADATYAIPNFLGGEISAFAQGRFDKPDYRTSLKICFNALPVEAGTWTRRPGTQHGATTRSGLPGRVIKFDFEQSNAVTLEFTDTNVRFRAGAELITGNDPQQVLSILNSTPPVVQTATPHNWVTGNTVQFDDGPVILQNRVFNVTLIDATHFSLTDNIGGSNVDGPSIGTAPASTTVARHHELATPYTGGSWAGIRAVQANTTDILLTASIAPQALTVTPAPGLNPVFALNPAIFNDGPYLDFFTNGVQATPAAKIGIISLTLAFPAYDAAKAYAAGAFVTSASINYISLVDQNLNNTPAISASVWAATPASAAINNGKGFLGTDIGRLVRLFSEPPAWVVGTTYAASTAATPVIVSYNPTGLPGETLYYQAAVVSTGKVPGTDTSNWTLIPQGAAIWTWGRITGLSNIIDRAMAGSASIGDMVSGGGNNAAFDGIFSQAAIASAESSTSGTGGGSLTLTSYVGKNYSGASDQAIQQATIYPSNDGGFALGINVSISSVTFNLRAKASAPTSSADGALLGTSGAMANTVSAVTVASSDQSTAWKYVWVEQVTAAVITSSGGLPGSVSYVLSNAIAELSLFNPPGTGTGAGVSVEILGPPLLYTNPISTWRLGLYSNTTGWPTCGTYDDGRLYLGGVVKNRFDASMSNGVEGAKVNFAPTNQYGVVAANNAISYTLNAKDANQIVWMTPEEGGLVMGTQAGEWLVRAPTTGPIAPNNISARRITKVGAANIEPYRTEHTNIFVHRYARKLTEYFPDAYSGKFTGPNLAEKAGHIISSGIAEIAYTSSVTPVIWGRCADGSLFGVTYKRDTLTTSQPATFYGWHRHGLGSGRVVESVCSGPSVGGDLDTLTMVTNDPATGIRHVELLTDTPDENAELADSWFLDNAVTPSSTVVSTTAVAGAPYGGVTLTGLWHLNGEVVQVFAAGLDCGQQSPSDTTFQDFLVTSGSTFVPFGDGISAGSGRGLFTADFVASIEPTQIVVGFAYNSDGQLVRPIAPADTGARNGPALGKTRRNHQYSMLLSNSFGLWVGGDFSKLKPVPFKQANGAAIPPLTTFSGVVHDALSDDYSYDGMVAWRVSRCWPANVVAISGNIQTQDR